MRETDVGSQSADTIKLKFRKGFRAAVRVASVCTEVAEVSDDRRTKGSLGIFTLSLGSIRPGDPANIDTPEEARGFLSSIEKGDPGSGRVIAETAAQVLKAFIGKGERFLRKGWCCQTGLNCRKLPGFR